MKYSLVCAIFALCGFVAATPVPKEEGRIVNGKPANADKTYLATIRLGKTGVHVQKHFCGGAIIDSKFILTAAHCFHGESYTPDFYTIGVGSLDLKKAVTFEVEKIVMHASYDSKAIDNDIALVKLKTPIDFNKIRATMVRLPSSDYKYPYHKLANVAGWGVIGWKSEQSPDYALETQLQVLEATDYGCAPYRINNNKFCAGNNGDGKSSSTCQGDSGGPVVYDNTVIGIVSYASECNDPNLAGVYTKVSTYASWIATTKASMGK